MLVHFAAFDIGMEINTVKGLTYLYGAYTLTAVQKTVLLNCEARQMYI